MNGDARTRAVSAVTRLADQLRLHQRQQYFRLTRSEVEALALLLRDELGR